MGNSNLNSQSRGHDQNTWPWILPHCSAVGLERHPSSFNLEPSTPLLSTCCLLSSPPAALFSCTTCLLPFLAQSLVSGESLGGQRPLLAREVYSIFAAYQKHLELDVNALQLHKGPSRPQNTQVLHCGQLTYLPKLRLTAKPSWLRSTSSHLPRPFLRNHKHKS